LGRRTRHAALRELGPQDVIEGHELVFLAFLAGMNIRTGIFIFTNLVGIGTAIHGCCVTTDGSASGNIQCVLGIAGIIAGLGLAYNDMSRDRWIERKVSDPISLILPRFQPLSPLGGGLYGRAISFEIPLEKLQVETEDIYKDPRQLY
jgi:hypothetical protein